MSWERIKRLAQDSGPSPYSVPELSKHIDPVLYADLENIQRGYVRKQLTVAFWDISGFSQLCNDLSLFLDDIFIFLDRYFEKAIEITKKHDGVLDKFIGDGVFAYFGYRSTTSNGDPHNAIRAALEFQLEFPKLAEEFTKFCSKYNGKTPAINLKCGMDNGPTLMHYFNTPKRNSVNIVGPTVNLASRLEAFAENDEIIISQALKNMVQDRYEFIEIKTEDRAKGNSNKGIKAFEKEQVVYSVKPKS